MTETNERLGAAVPLSAFADHNLTIEADQSETQLRIQAYIDGYLDGRKAEQRSLTRDDRAWLENATFWELFVKSASYVCDTLRRRSGV